MPSLYRQVKSSAMKNISHLKSSCQSDFGATPLGRRGAIREEPILTPVGATSGTVRVFRFASPISLQN
jgi:hypothetical protein